MSFIDKSSQWRLKKEVAYGTPIAMLPADIVELINPTMDAATELLQREILKNSLVMAQPLLGKETSSGSAGVELSSVTGTIGTDETINGDILYESGMGNRIAGVTAVDPGVVTIAHTATTVTVIEGDGVNYSAGQAIRVGFSTPSADEFVVIRSIAIGGAGVEDVLTVSPALTGVFADINNVEGLLSYTIARPEDPSVSMTVQEYFKNAVDYVTYTYAGVVVSDMTVDFPLANIVKSDFTLAGATFDVVNAAIAGDDRDPFCLGASPYVAKNMTFTYDDVSYAVDNLNVNIASDVYDTEALTTDGISNKTITGKSNVGGTFGLEYADSTLFDAFKAGTSGELFGTVSNATTTMGIFAPKVIISQSSKSVDSGLYKDSADFTALSSALCSADVEDALTIFVA